MDLDSVRALKREVLVRRRGEPKMPVALLRRLRLTEGAHETFREQPPIAVGISHHRGEHHLAVRIHHPHPEVHKLVEHLRDRACGEVDVRFVGRVHPQGAIPTYRRRRRPLRIGDSAGLVGMNMGSGTLGCFVEPCRGSGPPCVLSNNHVLANENAGKRGDPVVQPGPADGGEDPADRIATLLRFVALKAHGNRMDAALAELLEDVEYDPSSLRGLGKLAGVRSDPLKKGDSLTKLGRTSGRRSGRVSAVEIDNLQVSFPAPLHCITFDHQIEVEPLRSASPFSRGGDSGALVVDGSRRAVGLLFAGNDSTVTYLNPIAEVLDRLDVRLLR